MVKPIVKDVLFLSRKSSSLTADELYVVKDLRETYRAHKDTCAGMAANMIGYNKTVLILGFGTSNLIMINPLIKSKTGKYTVQEGCLSLSGTREAVRYETIKVEYFDERFRRHTDTFSGFYAQVIQHEIDHFSGILI